MIGILNGITGIRYGAECWCVQDVVNTERGELPDIRVSEATSFFDETIFHPFGQRVVGEGDRGIVEIPANDNRVGGLLHMIFIICACFARFRLAVTRREDIVLTPCVAFCVLPLVSSLYICCSFLPNR